MIAGNCLALDTDAKVSRALARRLGAASVVLPGESLVRPVKGLCRYLPMDMRMQPGDIDAEELAGVLEETPPDFGVWLVQHCHFPGWKASRQLGSDMGGAAAYWAKRAGYCPNRHVGFDLEGCASVGAPVVDWVNAWCDEVLPTFPVLCYGGYERGLSSAQMFHELPNVHLYWKAPGPWEVDVRGCALHQHPEMMLEGIAVDPNIVGEDNFGARLHWMVRGERA